MQKPRDGPRFLHFLFCCGEEQEMGRYLDMVLEGELDMV